MTSQAANAATITPPSVPAHATGFTDTLASEWLKLTTTRSTAILLGLGIILSIGTTGLVSLAMASVRDEWPDGMNPAIFSMAGNVFTLIIYSVFGVMVATREYSSGMIRLTLSATPARGQVLAAKALLIFLLTLAAGLVSTTGMFLVGQLAHSAFGMPATSYGELDAWRMVVGLGAVTPFFPLAGLALGTLLRSTAGATTTVLGLLWLPVMIGEFLPPWWQENIISLLPGTALDSFTIAHVVEDSSVYVQPLVGATVAAAWLAAILGAAWAAFLRRDV
jgi:ABC-2 type transport system permease protein